MDGESCSYSHSSMIIHRETTIPANRAFHLIPPAPHGMRIITIYT